MTEAVPLIYRANQWTGFYMITAPIMKGLNHQKTIDFLMISGEIEVN